MSLKSLLKAATSSPALFFPYTFSVEGPRHFLICRVPQACILVVLFNLFLCLLYFLHIGSCIQRLAETLGLSLWQGNGVFHQEAHNVWFCHIHLKTQWCSTISRSPTSLRAAQCVTNSNSVFIYCLGYFFKERLPFMYHLATQRYSSYMKGRINIQCIHTLSFQDNKLASCHP